MRGDQDGSRREQTLAEKQRLQAALNLTGLEPGLEGGAGRDVGSLGEDVEEASGLDGAIEMADRETAKEGDVDVFVGALAPRQRGCLSQRMQYSYPE